MIRVRKVLAELSEGIDAATQLSPAIHRVCAVEVRNAQYHIPYDCYAGALAELRASHPEIEVDSTRVAAMPAPERHYIYIGAMELSEMEGLDERRVHSVGMVAVFAAGHPLEQMDEISLDDLHGYPLLLMDRRHMSFVEPPMGPFLGAHHFEVDHLQAEEDDGKNPRVMPGPRHGRPYGRHATLSGRTPCLQAYSRPDVLGQILRPTRRNTGRAGIPDRDARGVHEAIRRRINCPQQHGRLTRSKVAASLYAWQSTAGACGFKKHRMFAF